MCEVANAPSKHPAGSSRRRRGACPVSCLPAEAAREGKARKPAAAHSVKHRSAAVAAPRRDPVRRPGGPLYNGQDYLGDDPDPNIRSQILRDHGRYGSD